MQFRKRIIVTLLAILVVLGMMPGNVFADENTPVLPGHSSGGNQNPDEGTGGEDPIPTVIKVTLHKDLRVYETWDMDVILTDCYGNPLKDQIVLIDASDREGIFITDPQGKIEINDIYYTSGNKTVTVKYIGVEGKYLGSEDSITFYVDRLATALTIQTDKNECFVGEDITISGRLYLTNPEDYPASNGKTYTGNIKGQTVTLFINDEEVKVTTQGDGEAGTEDDDREGYSYIFTPDAEKEYVIRAEFKQDDVYCGCTAQTTLSAKKTNTTLDLDTKFSEGIFTIKVQRTIGATGDITVYVDEQEHIIQDTGTGEFVLELDDLSPGTYEIKAVYAGDAAHTAAESQPKTVTIPKWYKIRFEDNSYFAIGGMEDQIREVGDGLSLPPCGFYDEQGDFHFCGWNTDPYGGGDAFADQDGRDITQENGALVTLYTRWNSPQILINKLPASCPGKEYSITMTQTGLEDVGVQWSISEGQLPEGLSIDPDKGEISGTPTESGDFKFRVEMFGAMIPTGDLCAVNKEFTLTISHDLTKTEAKDAKCTEDGRSEYWTCSRCGGFFGDENGEREIEEDSWIINAIGHDFSEWTKLNEDQHHRICSHDDGHVETEDHAWDDGKVSIEGLTTTTLYTCTVCKATYEVVTKETAYQTFSGGGGEWTKGSADTLNFTFKRSEDDEKTFGLFKGIKVDGSEVDKSDYDAEAGSVIIKLKPEYLKTLREGAHTLAVEFEDGEAAADFTIGAADPAGGDDDGTGGDDGDGTGGDSDDGTGGDSGDGTEGGSDDGTGGDTGDGTEGGDDTDDGTSGDGGGTGGTGGNTEDGGDTTDDETNDNDSATDEGSDDASDENDDKTEGDTGEGSTEDTNKEDTGEENTDGDTEDNTADDNKGSEGTTGGDDIDGKNAADNTGASDEESTDNSESGDATDNTGGEKEDATNDADNDSSGNETENKTEDNTENKTEDTSKTETKKSPSPNTGDEDNAAVWIMSFAVAAALIKLLHALRFRRS